MWIFMMLMPRILDYGMSLHNIYVFELAMDS